jgi:hypothetical protein
MGTGGKALRASLTREQDAEFQAALDAADP